MGTLVREFRELVVWKKAFDLAMTIFEHSKAFPKSETYSLTDQIRRSSRSVAANLAEAWEKRRYEASFIAKLTDACAEAAETQNWLAFAQACGYVDETLARSLNEDYAGIIKTMHSMAQHAERWCQSAK